MYAHNIRRGHQVNDVLQRVPNARQVAHERLEITVHLPQITLTLVADMGGNFPDTPPAVTMKPSETQLIHPLVRNNVVMLPRLEPHAWSATSSLADALLEVIQQMQERPPVTRSASASNLSHAAAGSPHSTHTMPALMHAKTAPAVSTVRSPRTSSLQRSSEASTLPFVLPETLEELQELDADDDALEEFLSQQEKVTSMQAVLADLHKGNKTLAESNLSKKDILASQKHKLEELWAEQTRLREQLDAIAAEHVQLAERYKPSAYHSTLRAVVAQADTQAETTAAQFLDKLDTGVGGSDADVDSFLRTYRSERRRYHTLAGKLEVVTRKGLV
ncbi:hypothetical protein RI367_001296 [Sorochytrium milnesiophthora]